jgi:hypothetical protein
MKKHEIVDQRAQQRAQRPPSEGLVLFRNSSSGPEARRQPFRLTLAFLLEQSRRQ